MRIALHTQYYLPEMGAPQARLSELARLLRDRGHEVFVLTAMPNYPTGRVFDGYTRRWRMEEELDGVEIRRCFILPSQSPRMLPRMLSYLSFVTSSCLIGAAGLPRIDFLLTESPPLFLGLSGLVLSRLKRARWIFNVSDLWPRTARELGVVGTGPGYRLAQGLESLCYRKAWTVTGQSREIVEDIEGRFPSVTTVHLSNGVDTDFFSPDRVTASFEAAAEGCRLLYAGLHGIAQGLDQVVEAIALLEEPAGVELVMLGDGPTKQAVRTLAGQRGLGNIRFLPPASRDEVADRLAAADVAIVPLARRIHGAVPSKLYEAMASGTAVLLIASGEAADIVRRSDCGVVVAPGDPRAVAGALRRLIEDPGLRARLGENGRKAAVRHYDRRTIVARFAARLEAAATS